MKLKKIYLDGFGHFYKHTIDDISDNVTVFYGPNEAGKSTLLAFIRGVLFGFPRNYKTHYPPLSGGKHGGRITISDATGDTYIIERFGKTPKVTYPNGNIDTKTDLVNITGRDITQNQFKTIFAFSLDELQNDKSLDDSNIYSAGQGVPKLPEFLKSLDNDEREIYNHKSKKQTVISKICKELEEIDSKLETIKNNAKNYGVNLVRKDEINKELEITADQLVSKRERQNQVERLRKGWNDWVEMENIKNELKEIPEFDKFPEDPITRLDYIEREIKQLTNDYNDEKDKLANIEKKATTVIEGESLLDCEDRINEINRERAKFDSAAKDRPDVQSDLDIMEQKLSERLEVVGERWNESNLCNIDISVSAKNQVDKHSHILKDAENVANTAKTNLDNANNQMNKLKTEYNQIQSQLNHDSKNQECTYLEKLLESYELLENVKSSGKSFDDSIRNLANQQGELKLRESNLEHELSELGKDWNADRVNFFDTSIQLRQDVESYKKKLTEIRGKAQLTNAHFEQEDKRLNELQNKLDELEKHIPEESKHTTHDEIDRQREALQEARKYFNDYKITHNSYENLKNILNNSTNNNGTSIGTKPSKLLPASLIVSGAALVAAGTYIGETALILGIASGAALLCIGAYLSATRKKGSSPASIFLSKTDDAKSDSEKKWNTFVNAAKNLNIDNLTESSLESVEKNLSNFEKRLEWLSAVFARIKDAKDELEIQERNTSEIRKKSKEDEELELKTQREWEEWLENHDLSNNLIPDTVIELIGRIKSTREMIKQIDNIKERIDNIQKDNKEYLALVQILADICYISFDENDHQKVKTIVDNIVKEFDRANNLVGKREQIQIQVNQHKIILENADKENKKAVKDMSDVQSKWNDWLQEHNMDDNFNPNDMRNFITSAEHAVTSLDQTHQLRNRITRIQKSIDEFYDKVKSLASDNSIEMNSKEAKEVARIADLLIKRQGQVQYEFSQRKEAIEKRDETVKRLKQHENRLEQANTEYNELLEKGGAKDNEDFRRRSKQYTEQMNLKQRFDLCNRALSNLSGPNEKMGLFLKSLNDSNIDELGAEDRNLNDKIQDMEKIVNELQKELGGINTTLEQLESEEESSALKMRKNVLEEQLLEYAKRWSQIVLAKRLLEKTQQKFEQERQPDVIKHARDFFHQITDKRYNNIYTSTEERKIMVTDAEGNNKQPSDLSRGTKEQLYLALRFGLIQDLGRHTERLPIVIDEVLVNFDAVRAKLTAQSLKLLAKDNQILVFTCHHQMRDLFVDVTGAKVIEIKSN